MPTQPLPSSHDSKSEHIYVPHVNGNTFGNSPTYIANDDDRTNSNIFCFGAFADKRSRIIYNDLTGSFPYMSLQGNVCFLIVYHYETNDILALPISSLDDIKIFATYKTQFIFLENKGHKNQIKCDGQSMYQTNQKKSHSK